jgi:hypothetical protein
MRPLLGVLLLAALVVAGCGGGPETTQTRRVAPFDRIEASSSIDVRVVPGDADTVKVIAGEHVIDHVMTSSAGGVLHLSIRDHGLVIGPDPYDDARVEVSSGMVHAVRLEGSSDVSLGRLDADDLSIDIAGSGDVEAEGTVEHLIATIEGSGSADLSDLAARTASVSIAGSGDADVNVADRLDVTVRGSGDVSYRGNPRVSQSVAGSGEVHAEG